MVNKLEVLVVDDSPNQQEAARRQFSTEEAREKYNLTIASDYLTAESIMMRNHFDCLLTDLHIPFGKNENGDSYPLNEEKARIPEPIGYALALTGLALGVGAIAIVSMENHHSGAGAATYERLGFIKPKDGGFGKITDNLYIGRKNEYPSHPRDKDWLGILQFILSDKQLGGQNGK